jgi:small-conductance mechanosensitive channel
MVQAGEELLARLREALAAGWAEEVAVKAAEVAGVVLAALAMLLLSRRFVEGLVRARVIDPGSKEYAYAITRNLILVGALLLAVYVATGSQFLMILVAIGATALLFSSWDALSNLVSYYIILGSKMVSRDEYLVLPNGIHGKVKEIKPFYIVLENRYGYYMVPNSQIVRSGKLTRKEMSYFRLSIRLWGLSDHSLIERVKERIQEEVYTALREVAYKYARKPSVVIDEISEDSVTLRVVISLPDPEPRPERVSELIMSLSSKLREAGMSHTITFEEPEGYEQRWAAVE